MAKLLCVPFAKFVPVIAYFEQAKVSVRGLARLSRDRLVEIYGKRVQAAVGSILTSNYKLTDILQKCTAILYIELSRLIGNTL